MGNKKNRHPPKFVVYDNYSVYRKKLTDWIETANYPREEMASMIALGLPNNDDQGMIRDLCLIDIGETLSGKRGLSTLISWMDARYA